jgi:outer membrane protein assembly factor BamD (BamD/ComL family)
VARGGASSVGSNGSPSSLADELRALDRAAAAVAAGEARRALDLLDAHDRDFKEGALSQEADVIRVEALAASGDDAAASAHARAFLARFPDGAQADHVRSVLGAIESKNKP